MNVHDWKLSLDSTPIAQILTFLTKIESTQIIRKSTDGTAIYIQTIGSGIPYADVVILSTLEEKDGVNVAQSEGALLTIVYRDKRYLGYIEEAPEWEVVSPGEWYQAVIKFLIEEEAVL